MLNDIIIWITVASCILFSLTIGLIKLYINEKEYKERMKRYEEMHKELMEIEYRRKVREKEKQKSKTINIDDLII